MIDNTRQKVIRSAAAVGGVFGMLYVVDPSLLLAIGITVYEQAGALFTASSIFAFTVVPNVEQLEQVQPYAIWAALGFAVVYLFKLARGVLGRAQNRVEDHL